jgi:hypothetical protein
MPADRQIDAPARARQFVGDLRARRGGCLMALWRVAGLSPRVVLIWVCPGSTPISFSGGPLLARGTAGTQRSSSTFSHLV